MKLERFDTIDFFRGIAVLIMIIANSTPYLFDFSNLNLIRIIFSLAAPIFIFIAGFTTQMNKINKKPESLTRIIQILIIAIFIDFFIWHSIPLFTFDVLYLIGFSKIILFLFNKFNLTKEKIIVIIVSIGLFILLSKIINYRFIIPDLSVSEFYKNPLIYFQSGVLQRLFYDGWFPIFPWFIFIVLGSYAYDNLNYNTKTTSILILIIGFLLIIFFYFYYYNSSFPVREKYYEIWYPLNGFKLILPVSICLIIYGLLFFYKKINFGIINILGQNSLFAYLLNAIIDSIFDSYHFFNLEVNQKILLFIISLITIITLTYSISILKLNKFWNNIPSFIKYLFGY